MYRQTNRYKQQRKNLARMREAKEQNRLEGSPKDYPKKLPKLRRIVIIIDFDFGVRFARMDLYRTSRVDCYDAYINSELWKSRIGWSRVLEWIRKAFPRVISERAL